MPQDTFSPKPFSARLAEFGRQWLPQPVRATVRRNPPKGEFRPISPFAMKYRGRLGDIFS
jgi:hypothetical protein